jgi:hypothetical protein
LRANNSPGVVLESDGQDKTAAEQNSVHDGVAETKRGSALGHIWQRLRNRVPSLTLA